MPSFAEFGKMLGEAVMKPAIPELAERGTAEAPALLSRLAEAPSAVSQRPAQPQVTTVPSVEPMLETTYNPQSSLSDGIQTFKTVLGTAIKRDPNLPKDLQAKFLTHRQASESAGHLADFELGKMLAPMDTDPARQATIWSKYLIASDELAQAMRDGRPDIMGEPVDSWKRVVSELQAQVDADPQITESVGRYRQKMDAMFGDAASRGWLTPDRYLEDYTPNRKLHAIAEASSNASGEDFRLRLLSMLQSREGAPAARETNMVKLLRETMAQYHRHVAEHELWMDLVNDKTLNMTDNLPAGTDPPRGFARFIPGPGDIGYSPKSPPEQFMDGAQAALPKMNQGYVFPQPLVDALKSYKTANHSKLEQAFYKAGNYVARQFTIYNPANTNVNRGSDLLVALVRAEELGASPMGIMKWYGVANKAAFRGSFGKGGTIVNINGQPVDLWEMAVQGGLPANTIIHDVGGIGIPQHLLKYMPEAQRNYDNWWSALVDKFQMGARTLQAERQAVELAPRIAAGADAFERSGNPADFGRVGREISFHYGAGAPKMATFPALRLIAPFIQFFGLSSEWILNTLNVKSMSPAKMRAIGTMVAVPTAAMLWNTQNDEYQKVEQSLHANERNQMHVIVPDPMDPAKVRRDINGSPVVLRFRWWVPEQVAQMAGLGNTPSRLARVATGQDTPIQFASEAVQQATENFTGMMLTPEITREMLTGQTDTGRTLDMRERLMRLSPLARVGIEGAETAKDYGPTEGAKVAAERWLGVSFAPTKRRGTTTLDAQFMDARSEAQQALALYKNARRNGTPSQVDRAFNKYMDALDEVRRLAPLVKVDQGEAPAPNPVREAAMEQGDVARQLVIDKRSVVESLRQKFPQYNDLSDDDVFNRLRDKFAPGMSDDEASKVLYERINPRKEGQ